MELGSEFHLSFEDLTKKEDNIFWYLSKFNTLFFDYGRSALKHCVRSFPSKYKVYLPEYICESVRNCFTGNVVEYYSLDDNFRVQLSSELIANLKQKGPFVFYLMHYFGHLQDNKVLVKLKKLRDQGYIYIIEDTTHSLFSNPLTIGNVAIASLRKWFPVEDGAVLYSESKLTPVDYEKKTPSIKNYAMILKSLYLKDEIDCHDIYRNFFTLNEEKIDANKKISLISDLSNFYLSCFSINDLVDKRKRNYTFLSNNFKSYLDFNDNEVPFIFLIKSDKRDLLRQHLIKHKIYCAVHWPSFYQMPKHAETMTNTFLSLPIDQRYSRNELQYMINVLQKFKG